MCFVWELVNYLSIHGKTLQNICSFLIRPVAAVTLLFAFPLSFSLVLSLKFYFHTTHLNFLFIILIFFFSLLTQFTWIFKTNSNPNPKTTFWALFTENFLPVLERKKTWEAVSRFWILYKTWHSCVFSKYYYGC